MGPTPSSCWYLYKLVLLAVGTLLFIIYYITQKFPLRPLYGPVFVTLRLPLLTAKDKLENVGGLLNNNMACVLSHHLIKAESPNLLGNSKSLPGSFYYSTFYYWVTI